MMTIKEFEIQNALGSLTNNMKRALAEDLSAPVEVLIRLSKDKDMWVRWRIANNLATPEKVLAKLSTDKNWNIRYLIAKNPNTPIEVLVERKY